MGLAAIWPVFIRIEVDTMASMGSAEHEQSMLSIGGVDSHRRGIERATVAM
jgi:hypothetical protein